MKKEALLVVAMIIALSASAQTLFFEQDIRVVNHAIIPTTQIQWDQKVSGGLSMGPYALMTTNWSEVLFFFNYAFPKTNLSFGVGFGAEQLEKWCFRSAPWALYMVPLGKDKTVNFFSLWEVGRGQSNYWYTNSITYETSKISLGGLFRRSYGLGPILGYKVEMGSWKVKLSAAPLCDLEDKTFKPTLIITVGN